MKSIAITIILIFLAFILGAVFTMKITLGKIQKDIEKIKKWIRKKESQNE